MKTNNSRLSASAIERSASLSRRHFLRGFGACLALPAFESLRPLSLFAGDTSNAAKLATTPTGAPLRSAFIFFPNGAIPSEWWPTGNQREFELGNTLKPLAPLRESIQVLGGLDHACANPGTDGGGDHARGTGVFLTGVRLKKSATDIHAGVSIDQMIAREVGHLTRFPSLELTCDNVRQSAACDANYSCAYQFNISWSSPTTPMTPEANPRLAFERLFGAGAPGQRAEAAKRRLLEQRSVLDFVLDDARRLQQRLTARDKDKLDQYLTGVRSVEERIQKSEQFGPIKDPDVQSPAGVPSSHEEYVKLMFDLIVLAFQTDSTRVVTFCLAHDGDNRSFGEIGIPEGHHDLSHHQNKAERIKKVTQIDLWYATRFAEFLQKLETAKDLDGRSLLHNSMVVYGSGNADGNRHTHTNLPIVLAGGGGGSLTPGRYLKYGSKPATNLFLSLAGRMGLQDLQRFGDSSGRLEDI